MTLRALIVDDEAVARRRIRRLLAAEPDVTVVTEEADGASAVDAIARERPDLVFLDVQMPELDGFDVVRAVGGEHLPAVIFVTAFDRYALRAFEVHAIDYLLKPFTPERFRTALARARQRVGRGPTDRSLAALSRTVSERRRPLTRVVVPRGGRLVVLEMDTVDWIGAADNYVRLLAGGREYLLRETLSAFEKQLDPEQFVRIHRSTIVRIDRIAELRAATHGDFDVVLRDGTRLALSRTWSHHVRRAMRITRT